MGEYFNADLFEIRDRIIKEIISLSYDEFNSKVESDQWSIAQVCHHLFLVEKASTKGIAWGLKTNHQTTKEPRNVGVISDRTKKLKAPQIVEPDVEPFDVQQIIDLLNNSRNNLMEILNTVEDKSVLKELSVEHPVYGGLSLQEWIELIYLHEQRHIEQIHEIKESMGAKR